MRVSDVSRTALTQIRANKLRSFFTLLGIIVSVGFLVAVIAIIVGLLGRNHAAVVQILGSTLVAITMLLFIVTSVYHMWLGMQVIIEDYVHDEIPKLVLLMLNTFFTIAVALASAYAIFKLSFGV